MFYKTFDSSESPLIPDMETQSMKLFKNIIFSFFFLMILVYGGVEINAQQKKSSSKITTTQKKKVITPPEKVEKKPSALNISGLKQANLFSYIHDGRFERFKDNETSFKMMFVAFVPAFSANCPSSLPKDKVEITYVENTYSSQMNYLLSRRGVVGAYSTTQLENSKVVGTKIYADPQYYQINENIKQEIGLAMSRQFLNTLGVNTSGSKINLNDISKLSVDLPADFDSFLNKNGCDSPSIKKFSDNLLRLANNKPSIQAQNGEPSYFEKECSNKLPTMFPNIGRDACKCLNKEFSSNLVIWDFQNLEDKFDLETFLVTSFMASGLNEKVSTCLK